MRPSKKQQEMMNYIRRFITEFTYAPTYREIMSGLGYKSVSTVAVHVDKLIQIGLLRKKDNSARSLEIVSEDNNETQPDSGYATLHQITEVIEAEYRDESGAYDKETLRWVLLKLRGETKIT